MSNTVIQVENLTKCYRLGSREKTHDTLGGMIGSWIKSPLTNFRRLQKMTNFKTDHDEDIIWALKDVSFEVKDGEVVGIIGRNGAGKSTLLKIISRITDPTAGRVILDGRVSSLLEVGTGFHKDLTGRENVYLNGTILGMSKKEIDLKFDEIVSFSEVEKFIDTPVKFYSSGMKMRLAFAIAAHLEPEILIIDEVLAVGDVGFQKKCINKMDEVGKKGRTVLFVSHNMDAVSNLCERVILLQHGHFQEDGPALDVIAKYMSNEENQQDEILQDDLQKGYGLIRPQEDTSFFCGDPVSFRFEILCPRVHDNVVAGIVLLDVFENPVVGAASRLQGILGTGESNRWTVRCDMGNIPLNTGLYHVNVNFGNEERNYAKFSKAFTLNILPSNWGKIPKRWGSFFWKPVWEIKAEQEEQVQTS